VYLVSQLASGPLLAERRSDPSVLNACFCMAAFGAPGLVYVWKTGVDLRMKRHAAMQEPDTPPV
jgi:hypothetical protein